MSPMRRILAIGAIALAFGGASLPVASSAFAAPGVAAVPSRTWHATVQCQIVRISDNNVIGYDRADGTGNSKENAILDAKKNVPVPAGHYKRHCDAKRVW